LINCCSLSRGEWGACIAAGSTPLIVSLVLKLTPQSWVDSIPVHKFIAEDEKSDHKVLKAWNDVQEKKNQL
jgi:hypothetical protein